MIDERIAFPVVIGRATVVDERISRLGLRMRAGHDFELVDPENDPRYRDYWQFYHSRVSRKGVSVSAAKTVMRTNSTVIAACMVAMKTGRCTAVRNDWTLRPSPAGHH